MIDKIKSTTFNRMDLEEWEKLAIESLRGMPAENLITTTAESIKIKPLYTFEQLASFSTEQTDTVREGQEDASWTIAQLQHAKTGKQFLNELKMSIDRGNESIIYDGNNLIDDWTFEQLEQLANLSLKYPIFAMNIKKQDPFLNVFKRIPKDKRKLVHGAISGELITLEPGFEHIRTVCADVCSIHHDGADAVTELAIALALAADQSISFNSFSAFAKQFFVCFSIDTHFFMEIAKLRAFRILWKAFSLAYGEDTHYHIPIHSENSLRSYSKLDPYVNLLRAGNEAFSAVLGGTDVLTIHPHDILTKTTPTSVRLARNVQLIIKHETLINKTVDPAGGSYFIETLTKELVEKSWEYFLHIEAIGGYNAYVSSGALENKLTELRDVRLTQLKCSEKSLIGTNIYPNASTSYIEETGAIDVKNRLAKPYESIQQHYFKEQPKITLITFGKLAEFKPRADFVESYLAVGGLTCEWSPAFSSVKDAFAWLQNNPVEYGIICASVSEAEKVVDEFIKEMPTSYWIDVAGNYEKYKKAEWMARGINGFIYKGKDQIAKLKEVQKKWEAKQNNEQA